jgi:PKD repeat protein
MKAKLAGILAISVCALLLAISGAVASVVTIEDGDVGDIDGTTVINLTLDTAPNGLSGYNMTVSLSDEDIAEIVAVEFPAWAVPNATATLPADTVWLKAADLLQQVDPGATNVLLAKLTIRGAIQGECTVNAVINQMDPDGAGDPLSPSVDSGVLTVAPVNLAFYPPTLTVYSTSTIDIVLDRAPSGFSGYNLTISLQNASIAEIVSVEYPTWATFPGNASLPADSFWLHATDATYQIESGDTNISLATLTLRGDTPGQGSITVTVNLMDNDEGYPMPVQTNPPTDPDGDGLYEDINGNGRIDFDDVTVYFNNMEWIEANEPVACFDYNGNGRIDFDDMVRLFNEV